SLTSRNCIPYRELYLHCNTCRGKGADFHRVFHGLMRLNMRSIRHLKRLRRVISYVAVVISISISRTRARRHRRNMSLLTVEDLKVHFPIKGGIFGRTVDHIKAVDGVTLNVEKGKTYGLVGESGSGKTTIGRSIIGLNHRTAGKIIFEGKEIEKVRKAKSEIRKDIQMIFQDPYSSLNPKKRVLDIVAEPIRNFENLSKKDVTRRVQQLLELVGLSTESIFKYPHQFSGGQRKRIGVARAIALIPKLIIADEPVSALDVSVQAQVLNFMQEIQKELDLTYIFISHDLGVIRHMCSRIGIMYRGRFVEEGLKEDI